jgi:hypothetical protein
VTAPTFNRVMAVAQAPLTVGCPRCLAGRGSHCRSSGGYQNSAVGFHAVRKAAVAHLSDDQRYDAYAQMRAEEAQLRAQVSAQLRQPLPADVREIRRRTGVAWDRIGREVRAEAAPVRRKPLAPVRGGSNVTYLDAYRKPARPDGVA